MSCSASSEPPRKRPRRKAAIAASAKSAQPDYASEALSRLKDGLPVIVFSGAGLSVSAGLSTFVSLYDQAAKRYGGGRGGKKMKKDGMQAFHYKFLNDSSKDCFQFLLEQYRRVQKASPTQAHKALEMMATSGQLIKHYTMNIDGLANRDNNNLLSKRTIQLHGCLEQLVCRNCGAISNSIDVLEGKKKTNKAPPIAAVNLPPNCLQCKEGEMRFRVLLYEDQEGHLVCPSNPLEATALAHVMKECALIIVVGVSFQQSASCEHFLKILKAKATVSTPVYLVSPEALEAKELLQTVVGDTELQATYPVVMTSDDFFSHILSKQETPSEEMAAETSCNAGEG